MSRPAWLITALVFIEIFTLTSSINPSFANDRFICPTPLGKEFRQEFGKDCKPISLRKGWRLLLGGSDYIIDYDPSKLKKDGGTVTISTEMHFAKTVNVSNGKIVNRFISVHKYFCTDKKQMMISSQMFRDSILVMRQSTDEAIVEPVEPGTISERIMNKVCVSQERSKDDHHINQNTGRVSLLTNANWIVRTSEDISKQKLYRRYAVRQGGALTNVIILVCPKNASSFVHLTFALGKVYDIKTAFKSDFERIEARFLVNNQRSFSFSGELISSDVFFDRAQGNEDLFDSIAEAERLTLLFGHSNSGIQYVMLKELSEKMPTFLVSPEFGEFKTFEAKDALQDCFRYRGDMPPT
jgi:hypothetical protein